MFLFYSIESSLKGLRLLCRFTGGMEQPGKSEKYALPLLLACALILSLLGANSALRSDEVWSVETASHSFGQMMAELKDDVHPPLFYLLLFPWMRLVGTSEVAIRALSGLLFVLAVWTVYKWAETLGGPRAGLLSAAIFLSCPLSLVAAQLARMYSLLLLASALSTWMYWNVFVGGKQRYLPWWAAANVVGSMTHVWFFFLLFAQGMHWLLWRRKDGLRFALGGAVSLTPYGLLWLPVLIRQLRKSSEATAWLEVPGLTDLEQLAFFYGGVFALALPWLLYQRFRAKTKEGQPVLGLLTILAVALAVPFAVSQVKPMFYARFTVIGLPIFAVAMGTWLARVCTWRVSVFLVGVTAAGSVYAAVYPTACDAQSAARLLAKQSGGSTAIFTALSRQPVDYYLKRSSGAPRLHETSFPAEIDAHPGYEGKVLAPERVTRYEIEAGELVRNLKLQHTRVFYFHGFHPELDQLLLPKLEREFHAVPDQGVKCKSANCYYTKISVFEPITPVIIPLE